jgi:4-hydroxy-tetrahydrodipicolinate reductase
VSARTLAVIGASGRMGRAVVRFATAQGDRVVCAIAAEDVGKDCGELAGIGAIGILVQSDVARVVGSGAAVVIDFSSASAMGRVAEAAVRAKAALVSGTTGLDAAGLAALDAASQKVPVLWEPNMSVGVHVLAELVKEAVVRLGPDFDIEIVEAHHRAKADAPSGTALRLAEVARDARGDAAALVHGREGKPGARPSAEIGVHAVRGGDVAGDHAVYLLGSGERLELWHRASSRDVFARGALRAAAWLGGKPPGRYTLGDVLSASRS